MFSISHICSSLLFCAERFSYTCSHFYLCNLWYHFYFLIDYLTFTFALVFSLKLSHISFNFLTFVSSHVFTLSLSCRLSQPRFSHLLLLPGKYNIKIIINSHGHRLENIHFEKSLSSILYPNNHRYDCRRHANMHFEIILSSADPSVLPNLDLPLSPSPAPTIRSSSS